MTELEFKALATQGYNRIPVMLQTLADFDTPLGLYLKLTGTESRRNSFLLESVVGGERFGRYSFIGLPARTAIRAKGAHIEVLRDGQVIETTEGDPRDFIQQYQKRMLVVDELAIVDNLSGMIYLIVYANPAEPEAWSRARERLDTLRLRMRSAVPADDLVMGQGGRPDVHTPIERPFAKEDYLATAARAREHIMAGDLMQVQIGQLLRKPFQHSALSLYRALRSINPSPYMYYYDFGDFQVAGSSPEILVRQERKPEPIVTLRPIAGTRKRGLTEAEDAAAAADLLADPKERAEHLMLIDLARNDIGRLAKVGTVKVTEQMAIEKYSHVIHIVSNVQGELEREMDAIDVLRATFPAGTLTGAPKVRAMELIEELEPVKRGVYGGACGYLSYSGEMDVAIAIRTGVLKDGVLNVQAAAGVVFDSVPEKEWQETEMKARAVLRAAELVESGLANGG